MGNGREGIVFPVADDAALREGCTTLLDPAVRARMGVAARERVAETWNYDVAARGWIDAITSVAGEQPIRR